MIEIYVAIDDLRARAFWNRWIRPSVQDRSSSDLWIYLWIKPANVRSRVLITGITSKPELFKCSEWMILFLMILKLACKKCLTTLDCLFWPGNEFKAYWRGFGATLQTSAGNQSRLELHRRTGTPSSRRQRSVCSAAWGILHVSASLTLIKVSLKSKWTIPVL